MTEMTFANALTQAVREEMLYDEGQLLNPNLVDYHVPTFNDVPEEFETVLIENGDGPGPYGAKGVGEGGAIGPGAAIANAINDALRPLGAELCEIPATPRRVLKAITDVSTVTN